MLTNRNQKAGSRALSALLLGCLLCCPFWARTQDAVSFLKAETVDDNSMAGTTTAGEAQRFRFERNLIFFAAEVDGRPGNFILDTGAPTLLLNDRGRGGSQPYAAGMAADGSVALTNQRVSSFAMGGRELGKRWALALDLRSMERRVGQPIDGFVGHQLLRQGELRINYPGRSFRLLNSSRTPRHEGRAPSRVLRFQYVDHLPVVTLKIGGRKLRFAIDTGAGVNLIDEKYRELFPATGKRMNIQGLGGDQTDGDIVQLPTPDNLPGGSFNLSATLMDLGHLQSAGKQPIAGILGSLFFSDNILGIDYRRRKIYLW